MSGTDNKTNDNEQKESKDIEILGNSVNTNDTFIEIEKKAIAKKKIEAANRKNHIQFLDQQYTKELNEYNTKLQERATDLKHTVNEILDTRNILLAEGVFLKDYHDFLQDKKGKSVEDEKFRKELLKRAEDELKKNSGNIALNPKDILMEAAKSLDRYYDFIAYQLDEQNVHITNAIPWKPQDVDSLTGCKLSTWDMDSLRSLTYDGLVKVPKRKTSYSDIENSYRRAQASQLISDFAEQFNNLMTIRSQSIQLLQNEENFKALPEEKAEKAKAELKRFIDLIETMEQESSGIDEIINARNNPNSTPKKATQKMRDFLKSYTEPFYTTSDKRSITMKIDQILDSYLNFSLLFNGVEPNAEKIEIGDAQKDSLTQIQLLNQTIIGLQEFYESRFEGDLYVPDNNETKENGKTIHRIDGTKLNLKSGDPEIDFEFKDMSDVSLFNGNPSLDDVRQGELGDCYLLAALSALAEQDPDAIKGMMKDNGTTVTVRFFNDQKEPVYVTVDKSVPVKKGGKSDVYAKRSLWVQLFEKAYVCSGLHAGKTADLESGKISELEYTDISGGKSGLFIRRLFERQNVGELDHYEEYDLTLQDYEFGIPVNSSKDADHLFDCFNKGMILTASCERTGIENYQSYNGGITLKQSGLYSNHAYAITNFEKENGEYYVTVRNPHGTQGVDTNSNGDLEYKDKTEAKGYSRMKYSLFKKFFTKAYVSKYDYSLEDRKKLPEARKLINTYGYAVEKIADTLFDNDSIFYEWFVNSDKFNKFYSATQDLLKEMRKEVPDLPKMQDKLKNFVTASENYYEYCENDKKVDPKKEKGRSLARYKMAKIAHELGEVYKRNNGKDVLDKWEEFGYKECEKSIRIPLTAYEKLKDAEIDADRFVAGIEKAKTPELKSIAYDSVMFFLNKGYEKFNVVLSGKVASDDLMKFYKENEKSVMLMTAICRDSDRIASMMAKDGFFNDKKYNKEQFMALCESIKPIYEGIKLRTDLKEYKLERTIPDLAKITGTTMEQYRKPGYGYKEEAEKLSVCISNSQKALKAFADGTVNIIQTGKQTEAKVKDEGVSKI